MSAEHFYAQCQENNADTDVYRFDNVTHHSLQTLISALNCLPTAATSAWSGPPDDLFADPLGGDDDDKRSLYERANGYNYEAVKIFMPAGSKQPVVVHYTEHCPPDVGAAFIWLKNRDPERWRDVQNVDHVFGKYIISDRPMTEQEWARERATIIDEKVVEELPAPMK